MIDWIPPGIVRSSCSIQITWFPFDDQICFLKVRAPQELTMFRMMGRYSPLLTVLVRILDVQRVQAELAAGSQRSGHFRVFAKWRMVIARRYVADYSSIPSYCSYNSLLQFADKEPKRQTKTYECCPTEPYPTLMFYLHIRRRTLYYGFNLIIPSLLISIMTILGFTLPPESGEKITLGNKLSRDYSANMIRVYTISEITILISICFLLNMVADMTPPTSDAGV